MNIFEIEVHPDAEAFNYMTDEELDQLSTSITENGMLNPIIIDTSGKKPILIDGRNRVEACRRAGIDQSEIPFSELNGSDAKDSILALNINRRHMSNTQRAMAIARVHPVGKKGEKSLYRDNFDLEGPEKTWRNNIYKGRTVIEYSANMDLADLVKTGDTTLNEAYKEAMSRKDAKEDKSGSLATLREDAPDLAVLVDDKVMKLAEAMAARDERKRNDRANRVAIFNVFKDIFKHHEFMTREHTPTFKRLEGFEEEFKKDVGMSVDEALKKFDEIQKSNVVKSYLESI